MTLPTVATSLRFHRRRSGLTQREVANIICLVNEHQVSRHERATGQPSFLTAVAYEILFRAPLSQLFPGVYETVAINIEAQLASMHQKLEESPAKGREAGVIAHKLQWMLERRETDI